MESLSDDELAELNGDNVIPFATKVKKSGEYKSKYSDGKDGYTYMVKGDGDERLANFTVEPVTEITKDDGVNQTMCFSLKGKLFNGQPLHEIQIPANKFANMNWINENWGLAPCLAAKQTSAANMRAFIQEKAINIPRKSVYTYTGFRHINDKLCFLHTDGAIGCNDVTTELSQEISNYQFIEDDSITPLDAVKADIELINIGEHRTTMPLLAFMYLAPLTHFFKSVGYAPSFALFLKGKSGSYKTTTAKLFLSHFCRYNPEEPCGTNFSATANYIEKLAFTLKDVPLLVDDYHPATKREKIKMDEIAQRLARGAGDHASRGRMNSDGSLRTTYTPRCITIMTGEDLPDIGQSGLARFVISNFEKGDINIQKLSNSANNAIHHNMAMQGFIKWCIEHESTLPQTLKGKFETYRAMSSADAHGRTYSNIAWLLTAFEMFLTYSVDVGALSEEEKTNMFNEFCTILNELAKEQTEMQHDMQPDVMFLTAVSEMIVSNQLLITPIGSAAPEDGVPFDGHEDENNYLLFHDNIYNKVFRFYENRGELFPVGRNMLFKHLAKGDYIKVTKEGEKVRYTIKKNIAGKQQRVLVLKKSALENINE